MSTIDLGFRSLQDGLLSAIQAHSKQNRPASKLASTGISADIRTTGVNGASLAIKEAFEIAASIRFENGKDDEFRHRLFYSIRTYGVLAVDAIGAFVFRKSTDSEVASVALIYLGEVEHHASYRQRLALLIRALEHPTPEVRDGAVLGLDFLGESAAAPYLENVIDRESNLNVPDDMRVVLHQLRG